MRTKVSIVVFLLAFVILVPHAALAAGWGGGVSVPGWGPFDWRSGSSSQAEGYGGGWQAYHYGNNSWACPPTVRTEVARVVNPSTTHSNLTFWIENQQYSLAPGSQRDVSFVPGQTIQFDRGPGRERVRYWLEETSFTFAPTPLGWELYRTVLAPAANIAGGKPPIPQAAPQPRQPAQPIQRSASAPGPMHR